MDLGARVGSGHTADIYALDAGRVVKRFADGIPRDVAEREAEHTRLAAEAGLPVPAVHELTSMDGRPAIVLGRARGPTMEARMRSRPWTLRRNARRLARLQARVHAVRPAERLSDRGELRSVRDRLERNVREATGLDDDARRRVLSKLASLPSGSALCHGDFHPGNVLLTDEGPVVIDWLDAGRGHPAADVARTNLLLRFGGDPGSRILSVVHDAFRRWYLRSYCSRSEVSRDRVHEWELPVAAARLVEGVPEEDRLRSFVESRLQQG